MDFHEFYVSQQEKRMRIALKKQKRDEGLDRLVEKMDKEK